MGGSPSALDPVVLPLVKGPKILDVGCGFGKWGFLCLTNYWETAIPSPGVRPEIVGCDGYLPNVRLAKSCGAYKDCLHITFPPLPFSDESFDTVLMVELIEHLPDADAAKLVQEALRIARHRVVLSTPNFPDFREAHKTITGVNNLDAHLSYWSQERLRKLGFRIYGTGFHIRSRVAQRAIDGLCRRAGSERLRLWFELVGRIFPSLAENTVAVWTKA